ncbi:MAG TPA: hypothetical protein VFE62_02785 [Gemmataceae bacterium]|nr:hypothetical protein [Gemmataceae bacterium]
MGTVEGGSGRKTVERHPLACPRCWCPESRVVSERPFTAKRREDGKIISERMVRKTRVCRHCHHQFPTRE